MEEDRCVHCQPPAWQPLPACHNECVTLCAFPVAKAFTGANAVAWLLERNKAEDEAEAVQIGAWLEAGARFCSADRNHTMSGNALLAHGFLRHTENKEPFKNDETLYRFAMHEKLGAVRFAWCPTVVSLRPPPPASPSRSCLRCTGRSAQRTHCRRC